METEIDEEFVQVEHKTSTVGCALEQVESVVLASNPSNRGSWCQLWNFICLTREVCMRSAE